MNHHDTELTDVIIVLHDNLGMTIDEAIEQLKLTGIVLCEVDATNGVVEGTIETIKIRQLGELTFVNYVRKVFEYTADFPDGDPRNMDKDDESDLPDVDDAGA